MKLPIFKVENVRIPPEGYGFAFIDAEDKKLKIKKHNGVIEFTNDLSDTKLLDLTDYTAFEVYPTNAVISAGTTDEVTGLTYTHDVPADMTHTFQVRSCTPQATCDVVIDWGDGATSSVAKKEYTAYDTSELASDTEVAYQFQHTYSTPGRYIVKILGRDYFGFRALDNNAGTRSIMSR